jgi:hypothetical protein
VSGGRRCRAGKVAPCACAWSAWLGLSRGDYLGAFPTFLLRRRAPPRPAQGGARLGAPWLLDVLPILPRL